VLLVGAGAGAAAGARRGAGRFGARFAARFTVRVTLRFAGRAVLRVLRFLGDAFFFRDIFLLLDLRDFAFGFDLVRRFFAMRAPSKLNAPVF